MKAIIIDDERSARNILQRLLNRVPVEVEIVAMCEDLPSGVEAIKELKPDVVFLDVQMPEYAGFEIARFFDEIDFEIVFVTAHNEFALKAFELSAIDYLLKPIQIERITETVQRLEKRVSEKSTIQQIKLLEEAVATESVQKIAVIEKGVRHLIELKEVEAFEAEEGYTLVHLKNGKSHLSSKHLKHFERNLEGDQRFCRVHKSWIVNIGLIKSYEKATKCIQLSSDRIAKISRYRISEFEERISS